MSPSKVEQFDRCPLRWLLETAAGGGRGATASSALGTLVHEIAAAGARRRPGAAGRAAGAADRRGRPARGVDRGARATACPAHGREAGGVRGASPRQGRSLVAVEQDVEVRLGELVVRGQVDRLERDADGRLVVVDLKTGKTKPTKAEAERNPQLGVYQVAVEEGGFEQVAPGVRSSGGAELVQLGDSTQKVGVQAQPPLRRDSDPRLGADVARDCRRGHVRREFRGTFGLPLPHVQRAAFLPHHGRGPAGAAVNGPRGGGEQLGFDDLLGSGPTHPALVPMPSARRGGVRRDAPAGRATAVQEPLLPADPSFAGPLDAADIARLLGRPAPTPEQVEVIEAPLEPLLVVAGAGSGKTETMAARVVWLVANGHVVPRRCSASPSPARPRVSSPSASAAGCAPCGAGCACPASTRRRGRRPGLHLPLLRRPAVLPITGCGWVSSRRPSCSARLRPGSSPQTWCRRGTPTSASPTYAQHRDRGAAGSRRRVRRAPGRPGQVAASSPMRDRADRQLPAAAGRPGPGEVKGSIRDRVATIRRLRALVPLVERYGERKRELGVPRLRRPAGARSPAGELGARACGGGAGAGSAPCCWTSTRTPATPSSSCSRSLFGTATA